MEIYEFHKTSLSHTGKAAVYQVRNLDTGSTRINGAELMQNGYTVHTEAPKTAAVLHIIKE